jgi:WD40 repeat protein
MRRTFTKLLSLALLFVGSAIWVGSVQSQAEGASLTLNRITTFSFRSAVFSPDGKYLTTVDQLARIRVWNAATGQLLQVLALPSGPSDIDPYFGTASVMFTNGSAELITLWSGLAKLWDTASSLALISRCGSPSTIGGRLTRRVDVFGDEVPQYRPIKGEQVFLWDADGDEAARTRTDRNGDYSFPNLCPGTYTVHPGIASPLLPSRYEPSTRTTTVPARINQVASPAHLDFVRKQPPPPRQPEFSSRG